MQRIGGLVNTMLEAHDKSVITTFENLVVRLPAKGYGTTEFDMSDERRELLVAAGRKAMKDYFDTSKPGASHHGREGTDTSGHSKSGSHTHDEMTWNSNVTTEFKQDTREKHKETRSNISNSKSSSSQGIHLFRALLIDHFKKIDSLYNNS